MRHEKVADSENYILLTKSGDENKNGYIRVLHCTAHFHKAKELLFLTEGRQEVFIGGEKIILEAGDICFADEIMLHHYANNGAQGYVLLVGEQYFSFFNIIHSGKTLPKLLNNKEKNAEVFSIIEEWHGIGIEDNLLNASYLNRLMSLLVAEYGLEPKSNSAQAQIITKIMHYIEDNFTSDITLETLAKELGYCTVYCSKMFKKYMDESFRDYINRCRVYLVQKRINWRKNKSRLTDSTILEIVISSGFNSQATFYRAYKKIYGKNPKQNCIIEKNDIIPPI